MKQLTQHCHTTISCINAMHRWQVMLRPAGWLAVSLLPLQTDRQNWAAASNTHLVYTQAQAALTWSVDA